MNTRQKIDWYPDEKVFLKQNFFSLTNQQLLDGINARRADLVKQSTLLNQCRRMGLQRGIQIRWSEADIAYLTRNYRKIGDKELAAKLSKRYQSFRIIDGKKVFRKFTKKHVEKKRDLLGLKRTDDEVLRIRKRNIKNGTAFAYSKENHAWNSGKRVVAKEGDIRIWKTQDGKLKRHIKIDGKFTPYTRWFYNKNIASLAKNETVFHIDFDTLNDEPSNLKSRVSNWGISIADYRTALPLIQSRLESHLTWARKLDSMLAYERLEYHKTLIRLRDIEKRITKKLYNGN